MKTNNKGKIFALALSAASFLSLAGSITGTVAWYQYSTRATAGIIGESKTVTENLQISTDGTNWKSDLTSTEILNAAQNLHENAGTAISPITSGPMKKDAPLEHLYDNPMYQYFDYNKWQSAKSKYQKYITFNLYFQYVKKVNSTSEYVEKEVKLTDLHLEGLKGNAKTPDPDLTENNDLTNALRVHFNHKASEDTQTNVLVSKNGVDTNTVGNLDLNGDNILDSEKKYEWEENTEAKNYGNGVQHSYSPSDVLAKKSSNNNGMLEGGITLLKTSNNATPTMLTVTIWLEGWQLEGQKTTADWNEDTFKDKTFRVGMQFGCNADAQ